MSVWMDQVQQAENKLLESCLNCKVLLCSSVDSDVTAVPESVLKTAPSRSELDKYAEAQWEVTIACS